METGSFRDRDARVFYQDGFVYRALNADTLKDYRSLRALKFFQDELSKGRIVQTEEVSNIATPNEFPAELSAGVLKHNRIPVVSYPYEWSFGMLKDAALLHLDLLLEALDSNFILKDSSAFNIQFEGAQPVFIDLPSFEPYKNGEVWVGYRQFCEMFLYPLMLQAHKGVPFQVLLRGNIDGIGVEDFAGLLSFRDYCRAGVFKHVYLQNLLGRQNQGRPTGVRKELREVGFGKELIVANVKSLRSLVRGLKVKARGSAWVNYATDNSYAERDAAQKREFVGQVASAKQRRCVWDLGSNTGVFSRIASLNSDYVLAVDGDHAAIDRLYKELAGEGNRKILPLVLNLANLSPSQGWRGLERLDFGKRSRPELILALALIHHMVISSNIPLKDFIGWLAEFKSDIIIEFVTKDDPMVKILLANKDDRYSDYDQDNFEQCLKNHFRIVKQLKLDSGTRTLYSCEPQRLG